MQLAHTSRTMTKGAFATLVNRAPSAVSNWIASGKLTGAALEGDGRTAVVVVAEALRQLGMKLDAGQQMAQAQPVTAAPTTRLGADYRTGLGDAQERKALAEAEASELKTAQLRNEARERDGSWLPTSQARAEFTATLHQVLRTTEVWLQIEASQAVLAAIVPDDVDALATSLNTTPAVVRGVLAAVGMEQRALGVMLRDGYREHRRKAAERAGAEAQALPATVPNIPDPEAPPPA